MKHTLFTASPFRPGGYTQSVTPLYRSARMGQGVDDILQDLGIGSLDELLGELDDLITRVPIGILKSGFEVRRAECMTKSTLPKYNCLYELFQDAKRAARGEDGRAPVPTPTPTPAARPVDTFPWVPVGIAAGIGTAALLYFVFKKN